MGTGRIVQGPGPNFSTVQVLYFFSGPWGSPQKNQAGLDARILCKAAYLDSFRHLFPPTFFNQVRENHLQSNAMKRVFMFIINHCMPFQGNLYGRFN